MNGKRRIYDLPQLQARMMYWRELLRLHAWDIEVRFVEEGSPELERYKENRITAQNEYDWQAFESLISFLPEEHYAAYGEYDMEFVLVHEMLHLIIEVSNNKGTPGCEQAINQLTRALLLLDETKEVTVNEG